MEGEMIPESAVMVIVGLLLIAAGLILAQVALMLRGR